MIRLGGSGVSMDYGLSDFRTGSTKTLQDGTWLGADSIKTSLELGMTPSAIAPGRRTMRSVTE